MTAAASLVDRFAPTVLLAVSSHVVFARNEPSPWSVIGLYVSAWLGWTAFLHVHQQASLGTAFASTAAHSSVYTLALLTSMGVYRRFLHRLCRFPGPTPLILSKWASLPMDMAGKRPVRLAELHDKYGDVVRIGPRELSINDPNAVQAILGANSRCLKGPWYTAVHGGKGPRSFNLHVTIDPAVRRARRRMWDRAFSVRALSSYEQALRAKTLEVMEQLQIQATRSKANETTSLDRWCMLYSFDIMGLLGFSRAFGMVRAGTFSNEIALLESFMIGVMVLGNVPYLNEIIRVLPNPLQAFENYTEDALRQRVERSGKDDTKKVTMTEEDDVEEVPDVMAQLLKKQDEKGNPASWVHTWKELCADASLIIVAGSDTSSSVLSLALFSLATNPTCLERLRDEIDHVFGAQTDADAIDDLDALTKQCPYLNAVLNETMRLYPPVASGLQRVTPASGPVTVLPLRDGGKTGGLVLPADTVVSIPTSILQRDGRNFAPHPNAFRPERWIESDKEIAFDAAKAFIPFGFGPSGCVGKSLAWMEMRLFLAQFVKRFDMRLPDSFGDGKVFLHGIKDTFTMSREHPLDVHLSLRVKRA